MSWAGALAAIHITNTLTRNLTDLQRISVKMTSAFLSNIFFSFFVIHFIRRLRVFSCAMKLTSFSLGFFGVIRCYFQKKRRTKLAFKMHDRCLAKSREKKNLIFGINNNVPTLLLVRDETFNIHYDSIRTSESFNSNVDVNCSIFFLLVDPVFSLTV